MAKSAVLSRWEPENPVFWQEQGQSVAKRNLAISIPCLTLGFVISVLWSVVALNLNSVGFHFSKEQLFMLTALPQLSGATLRIFYSFMPARFGGRKWTAFSTSILLIPALWLGFAVQDPTTTYAELLIIALLCGLGSGNFASSMANIGYFFPAAKKGSANGLNAGFGNLGVSLAQLLIPLAITLPLFGLFGGEAQSVLKNGAEQSIWLQNAGFMWVPLITIASVAAWFGMNDIAEARSSFTQQAVIFRRKHNWLMCWLYIGTFGSFIGFAGSFALLTKTLFPDVAVMKYAFLGPLIGALIRPVGGMISDKVGGAKVTLGVFMGMACGVFGVLFALPEIGADGKLNGGSWPLFFAMFLLLFTCAGLGNGSTYKMIPTIFSTLRMREAQGGDEASKKAAHLGGMQESAAAAGFISAIGAYGGFFIPQSFGVSMQVSGSPSWALYCFIVFYVSCVWITWHYYASPRAKLPC